MGLRGDSDARTRRAGANLVAERLGALGLAGDAEGVATWKAIAQRIQRLSEEAPRLH